MEAGDIIIVLQQQKHDRFLRKGSDLFTEQQISLVEALTGVEFVLTHLDGRQLLVRTAPGEIIKSDAIKCIENEGFPIYRRPFEKGRLFIKFTVEFPKNGSIPPSAVPALGCSADQRTVSTTRTRWRRRAEDVDPDSRRHSRGRAAGTGRR